MRAPGRGHGAALASLALFLGAGATPASLAAGDTSQPDASPAAFTRARAPAVAVSRDLPAPFARRLQAELVARGLGAPEGLPCAPTPQEAAAWRCDGTSPSPFPSSLTTLLRVTADREPVQVEVWTRDPGGTSATLRTALTATSLDDPTLPVRAAEDARAFAAAAPAVAEHEVPAPPEEPATAEAAPPAAAPVSVVREVAAGSSRDAGDASALGIDGALVLPGDQATTAASVMLRARHRLLTLVPDEQSSWRLPVEGGLRAILPIVEPSIRRDGNRATLGARILAVEAHLGLRSAATDAVWEADVGLGLGLAWLRTSGAAETPFFGRSEDAVTALPLASAEIARRLGTRTRLRAGVLAGIATPAIIVRFGGAAVATWGRPLVALSLGIDVGL